jgi:pyridoxine 5-phosphate synthase
MTKLSVNVNKLATIRNARGKNNPDVVAQSLKILSYGAQGITVHPRPDERHIRRQDVYDLKKAIDGNFPGVELNIEGFPSNDFIKMNADVRPGQCTLVPDPPDVITSNAGWLVSQNIDILKSVASRLRPLGVRTSVFVDPVNMADGEYMLLKAAGIDRVELYTERYAETFGSVSAATSIMAYHKAAILARDAGLGINAGHDLGLGNLAALISAIPWIDEVSIGHALICDALEFGMKSTVAKYLAELQPKRG